MFHVGKNYIKMLVGLLTHVYIRVLRNFFESLRTILKFEILIDVQLAANIEFRNIESEV